MNAINTAVDHAERMKTIAATAFTGDQECIARLACGIATQIIVGLVSFTLIYSVFNLALWAWLSFLLAAIISLIAGATSGNWAGGPGFDLAKSGIGWLRARFVTSTASA